MSIRLSKTYNLNSNTIKHFEKVSESLILLNITIENESLKLDSRPLHWRYDFGDFPPLDISFDSETGLLKEITIFIKKRDIVGYNKAEKVDLINIAGLPSFEFEMLKKHEYYYDELCQMEITLYDSTLYICVLDEELQKRILVNEKLSILLNTKEEFIGLEVNHLSSNDLELFRS